MPTCCDLHSLPYQADPAFYFRRIHREPGAVLLDSGRPEAERGRYDICSAWPLETLLPLADEPCSEFLLRLRAALRRLEPAGFRGNHELPFAGGLIGYLSYDFGRRLVNRVDQDQTAISTGQAAIHEQSDSTGGAAGPESDASLGLYDWALISDHGRQITQLVFHPHCAAARREELIERFTPSENPPAAHALQGHEETSAQERAFILHGDFKPDIDAATYRGAIERIHEYIRAGDCYQVNYTQRFQSRYSGDPWGAYCALRRACPTPFSGYMNLGGDNAILSLSPERFMRLENGRIEARPIKGTRPRGATAEADLANADQLCNSAKDRAENLMIVDLLRNDIGRASRIGSVHVPELFSLESYPNVHHLVSCIRAELAEGLDAFDLLAAGFPGGSITGAPKIRAMEIIDELEPHARSLYCGSLLYVDSRGNMDSSITIRSLLALEGNIRCWGGGGIVMDSDWQEEYRESIAKVDVLLKTLQALPASGSGPDSGPDF